MSNLTIISSANAYGRGISEFARDPVTGVNYDGTCTQTALEVCVAAVEGRAPDQGKMVAYTRDMIRRKWAAPNGAATLAYTAQYARDVLKKSIAVQWDYQEPLQADWHSLLMQNAGRRPILMQVAYGSRLIDAQTGVRDEAAARGLRYHAIAIVGKSDAGYICCDSDHPQVTQRFQVYAYDLRDRSGAVVNSLRAAVPCGLLMLDMPAPKPIPVPKPTPPPTPKPTPPPADPYKTALQTIATLAESALLKG